MRRLEEIASARQCSLAQLSLAWLLARGEDIVPIAGTKRSEYLKDNLGALQVQLSQEDQVQLSQEDLAQIDQAAPLGAAKGLRYPETAMMAVNR
jgi:aryl-alcohol dehydrogenase-like predicted oxidoreductase